ncbi:MAG TPA: SDR family oxidoreductase [Stackebrandtia sp.]|jgi:NAD(P)-dependent dehydrogenase (short-subunit alcohol dehydrogenase family)|uniref:SDR family oxidoreductase n=1 Tax=Stackebrandtia sp. TaxID=2023065 RepID=UPI002D471A1E|nr:SDR family oxidoreductase [Stackebrandtia sp.]HZE41799.1 SDR family oxidoreductase [Stackebrandtia sp.]
MSQDKPLDGQVALVAGATRGTGRAFAVELARAGAIVYASGRSSRSKRSEMDRPETIEGTAELIAEAGGVGHAVVCDHLDREQVRDLVARIESEQGRLNVLVNDIWGGDHLTDWEAKLWEHDLDKGLHALRLAIDTHIITNHEALPLLVKNPHGLVVEITDGTWDFPNNEYRGTFFYDLAKITPPRIAFALATELKDFGGMAVSLTPGWIRSEAMLDEFGVTEANWRDGTKKDPEFCMTESPYYVARCLVALASDPKRERWNGKSVASWDLAPEYGVTDIDGTQPSFLRFIRDVREDGAPIDDSKYR